MFWGGLGGKERWGVSRAAPVVRQKSRGESRLCPHRSHRSGGDGVGGWRGGGGGRGDTVAAVCPSRRAPASCASPDQPPASGNPEI